MSTTKILTPYSLETSDQGTTDSSSKKSNLQKDDKCPICKSDRYLCPNMVIKVSECYHRMCESCIDRLFSNGSGECPECKKRVSKVSFVVPTFEDLQVEKEIKIRKGIMSQLYKREEDFKTVEQFDDYLELIEDLVWNLTNDIDIEITKKKIEALARDSQEIAKKNQELQAREAALLQKKVEQEAEGKKARYEFRLQQEEEQRKRIQSGKTEAMNLLAASSGDAKALLAEHKATIIKKAHQDLLDIPTLRPALSLTDSGVGIFNMDPDITEEIPMDLDPVNSPYAEIGFYTHKSNYIDQYTEITNATRAGGFSIYYVHESALQASVMGLLTPPLLDSDGDVQMDSN